MQIITSNYITQNPKHHLSVYSDKQFWFFFIFIFILLDSRSNLRPLSFGNGKRIFESPPAKSKLSFLFVCCILARTLFFWKFGVYARRQSVLDRARDSVEEFIVFGCVELLERFGDPPFKNFLAWFLVLSYGSHLFGLLLDLLFFLYFDQF